MKLSNQLKCFFKQNRKITWHHKKYILRSCIGHPISSSTKNYILIEINGFVLTCYITPSIALNHWKKLVI